MTTTNHDNDDDNDDRDNDKDNNNNCHGRASSVNGDAPYGGALCSCWYRLVSLAFPNGSLVSALSAPYFVGKAATQAPLGASRMIGFSPHAGQNQPPYQSPVQCPCIGRQVPVQYSS